MCSMSWHRLIFIQDFFTQEVIILQHPTLERASSLSSNAKERENGPLAWKCNHQCSWAQETRKVSSENLKVESLYHHLNGLRWKVNVWAVVFWHEMIPVNWEEASGQIITCLNWHDLAEENTNIQFWGFCLMTCFKMFSNCRCTVI